MQIQKYLNSDSVQAELSTVLGDAKEGLVRELLNIVTAMPDTIGSCEPDSLYRAALTARGLNLSLSRGLGHAWIVPYNNRYKGIKEAQFQIGYKGLIQLAIRSGEYETIGASEIYEGQLKSNNPLTGPEFDFSVKASDNVIGYAAFFKLKSGFHKTVYWPHSKVLQHGKAHSKAWDQVWAKYFNAMAIKTVLKDLLHKYGPLSTEMLTAIQSDQAVIRKDGLDYIDTEAEEVPDPEKVNMEDFIDNCTDWRKMTRKLFTKAQQLGLEDKFIEKSTQLKDKDANNTSKPSLETNGTTEKEGGDPIGNG